MSPYVPSEIVRHGDRLLGRGVLFLLLGIYTLTFVGLPDNADAEVEFQTTSALGRTRHHDGSATCLEGDLVQVPDWQ